MSKKYEVLFHRISLNRPEEEEIGFDLGGKDWTLLVGSKAHFFNEISSNFSKIFRLFMKIFPVCHF